MYELQPELRERYVTRAVRYGRVFMAAWTVAGLGWVAWVLLGPRTFALLHGLVAGGLLWGAGMVAAAVGSKRLRSAQRSVAASEAFFRALWDQSRDALFLMEQQGVVAHNAAAADLFEVETLVGRNPWEFSPTVQPDGKGSREAAEERIRAALQGQAQLFEWRHTTASGRELECEVALGPVQLGDRRLVLAAVRDISSRKQAEATTRLLQRAVEAAAESVMVTDPEGSILYVNPAFERITGYSREEVRGHNPRILKSGEHDEAFYRDLWETITAGKVWHGTFTNRRKDGALYREEAVISPVTDASGAITAFVAVRRDVTREEQMRERLRLAERMETVGQMAAVVAHDFNNLLMSVQGAAEIIALRAGNDPRIGRRVEVLRRVVGRGSELIHRLLTVAKRQVREPEEVDLGAAVAELEPTLEATVREDIRVRIVPPRRRLVTRVDPGQLEQVILNLVANARDAMPMGGELTLELEDVELDETAVAGHPAAQPGRFARLSVTDTGVGMDRETVRKIFQPFFTTKGEAGTGLGLATVYGIVEGCGGLITVYSEVGLGTTFKVYLPLVASDTPSGAHPAVQEGDGEGEVPRGEGTVLVVEDDPGVLESVCDLIQELGYGVIPAEDGEAAVRVLQERPLSVDLILSDIVLPGMDGGELARRAAELAPHVRIVFTSGYTENVIHHRFELRPGLIFLEKPYRFADLARALRRALDTRG